MYRLNTLKRNVLCTPDEVLFHGPTSETPDRRAILNAIIVAEERFIVDTLSYDLYRAITVQKNTTVTDLNKTDLEAAILEETTEPVVLNVGDVVNSSSFLSADNLALWNEYLWKLCAECVLLIAMPPAYVQYSATGMVHAQPGSNALNASGAVTPSLASMKWTMDRAIMDRIDPLIFGMQNYICRNKVNFSTYKNACACDNVNNEEAKHKRTDIVLGIYDQVDKKCCNEWDQLGGLQI